MKKVIFIIAAALLISCSNGRHINNIIDRAESIVAHNPDSALKILHQLSDYESLEDSLKARYWLVTDRHIITREGQWLKIRFWLIL